MKLLLLSVVVWFAMFGSANAENAPCLYNGTIYPVGSELSIPSNKNQISTRQSALQTAGFSTSTTQIGNNRFILGAVCIGLVAPPTSPLASPTESVGTCGESLHDWHPQFIGQCNTGHEHGDAPPLWTHEAPQHPHFTHPGGTPNENILKHSSFKGFHVTLSGVETYIVAHLDTHPNGQQTRSHSIQVWFRSSPVSYITQWLDFGEGDNLLPNLAAAENICATAVFRRPIIQVNFPDCVGLNSENWYARNGPAWSFDIGFNVSPQYYGGPQQGTLSSGNLADFQSWLPTGIWNTLRRVELAWYRDRYIQHLQAAGVPLFTTFYATQFGDVVSGPDDPVCGTERFTRGRTFTVLCLPQFVAESLPTISSGTGINAVEKLYPNAGLTLPN